MPAETLLKITGDSSSATRAVDEARERYEKASARVAEIDAKYAEQKTKFEAAQQTAAAATTAAEAREAQRRADTQEQKLKQLERAHDVAYRRMEEYEKKYTRTVQDEAKKQSDARAQSLKAAAGSFVGGLVGGPGGSLGGALIGGASGPLAAAAAAAAAAQAIRSGLDAWKEQVTVARELAGVLGSDVKSASAWASVAEQMGISNDALAQGFGQLSQAIKDKPEVFDALGISLENIDGSARPLIDVFADVQRKLADMQAGTERNTAAQDLFGRAYRELLPLIGATSEEIQNYMAIAFQSGEIVDQSAVAAEKRWEVQTGQLGLTLKNFAQGVVGSVVPTVIDALGGLGQAFDTLGTLVHDTFANIWNAITGQGGRNPLDVAGEAFDAAQSRANAAYQRLQQIGASVAGGATGGTGTYNLPPSPTKVSGGADTSAQDAIRDRIDAIRKEADARNEAARDALDDFEKEKQAALDAIEAEDRAREKQVGILIRGLRDGQDERERARDLEIRAIQDEQDAAERAFAERERQRDEEADAIRAQMDLRRQASDDELAAVRREMDAAQKAFSAREKQRDAERAAIREQIAALDARDQAAEDAKAISEAQAKIDELTSEDTTRVRSESLSDYEKRLADHDQQLTQARQALADVQTGIAKREAREGLEAQLDAIDVRSAADQRALARERESAEARIAQIQAWSARQQAAYQEQLDAIAAAAKADKEQTATAADLAAQRIKAIHDEADADRQQTADAIQAIQDQSTAAKEAYEAKREQLRDEMAAEKERVDDALKQYARETQARIDELDTQLKSFRQKVADEKKAFEDSGGTRTMTTIYQTATGIGGTGGAARGVPAFAGGGEILLTEPAAIVGMNSGRALAIAGEEGAELLSFGGAGGREIVIPLTVSLDGRVVARTVSRHQADRYSLTGGRRRRG